MLRPITDLTPEDCRAFRIVASDIDDTMTIGGRLSSSTIALLERAAVVGLSTIIVTGRPAGVVMALATYLPRVEAVIGENGGVLAQRDHCTVLPAGGEEIAGLTGRLEECREEIFLQAPEARVSGDNFTRLTDLTYVVEGISRQTRSAINRVAARHGFVTAASSVHVHVKLAGHSKGGALAAWMQTHEPPLESRQLLTVGDSETDASIFDVAAFPFSVGVANVTACLPRLKTPPAFITTHAEGEGFIELVELVLKRRSRGE